MDKPLVDMSIDELATEAKTGRKFRQYTDSDE